jgi:biotin transport system substrate-specific component
MSSTAIVPTLVRPSNRVSSLAADVLLVAVGVGLISLSAQISIPLPNTPVPLTGQTFAVLLVGTAYGATRATATTATYLLVGGLGFGVFADHASGWDVLRLSSVTGGYLAGMLVASALVGWLADRGWSRTPVLSLATMVLGNVVIYGFGVAWLMHATGFTFTAAWHAGVRPFLPGDAIKILLAAGLLPAAWRLVDAVRR